jgi:uncharacterized damage-inducible protein DinB
MGIAEALLPEFDREMSVTRRLLERVPDGQFDWKPHERCMLLGRLAEHLAEMPGWIVETITKDKTDAASGTTPVDHPAPRTRDEVLALFDRNVKAGRAALAGRTDAELMAPWTLNVQGKTLFTMPKATALRGFVMNHIIHHRGQLSVYLRLQNVSLPSMYGPSGDESA